MRRCLKSLYAKDLGVESWVPWNGAALGMSIVLRVAW